MAFQDDLAEWGPDGRNAGQIASRSQAETYCRNLATSHYENFPLVSWLLPRELHAHFYHVYAYCRWADDLGDEVGDRQESLRLLEWWRAQLDDCYAGRAWHPVFVALKSTIDEFGIPREPFADLISAFEQDQRVVEYDTFDQLRDYCRRSADPVGRIVLYLCRQFTAEHAAWSDSICTGLQLANFWQDVARDYDIGRIYLPRADYEHFGYSRGDFDERRESPEFLQLMKFQVDRARRWLQDGLPLIPRLPGKLQVDIDLFARGGLKILQRIEQIEYCVWSRRPVVTRFDALKLLAGALLRRGGRSLGIG